jgi:hypothetical protein
MKGRKEIFKKASLFKLSIVVHAYNPSTQESKAGGSQVLG